MQLRLICLAVLCISASATDDHPIKKIIGMLEELKVKSQTLGEEEAAANQKFEYWCKTTTKALTTAITEGKEKIENLESEIESLQKSIEKLEVDIATLEKQLEENEVASAKAKKIREDEAKVYEEADADFEETIDAIQTCIDSLEGTKGDVDSLLAQKSVTKVLNLAALLVSEKEQTVLASFLQTMQQQPKKPKAKVYSFKSQGVIELLKKLMEKFETDKLETTKAETNAVNAYKLSKQAREEAAEAATKSKDEKTEIKGQNEEDLAKKRERLGQHKRGLGSQ
jgi:predicted  nucleic acid-binding Zn-ribbon protein